MVPIFTIRDVVCYKIRPNENGLPVTIQETIIIRAEELGVSSLINPKTGDLFIHIQGNNLAKVIDPLMFVKAKKFQTIRAALWTREKDVRYAIDFLELLIVHVADQALGSNENLFSLIKKNGDKALKELETIRTEMYASKSALQPNVERALRKVSNLFCSLSFGERERLIKSFNSAKNILNRYFT